MSLRKQKGLHTSRKIGRISTKYVLKETKGKLHSCLVKKGGISTKYVLRKTKGKLHSYLAKLVEYLPSMSLGKQRGSCTVIS